MMISRLRSDLRELPRLALSLAMLAAAGFSVVLCAQLTMMKLDPRVSFTLSNLLGEPGRSLLLLTLAAGMLLPAALGTIFFLRSGPRALDSLEHWAALLSPLMIGFALPALFLPRVAESKPLFYLVMLSVFGLVSRALVATSARAWSERATLNPASRLAGLRSRLRRLPALPLPRVTAPALVLLLAAGYASFVGHYAIAHHRLIQTLDTDVGIAENVISNLLHGRPFRAPAHFGTLPGNYLTVQPDYIAWLFVPIYGLRPSAETLLWLQAVLASLAVLPLFSLCTRWLGQRTALWMCLAYLSLAPLQHALLSGFSWLPAFCLFSFTLYYAVVAERAWLVALSLPAVLASTEAGPVGVFAFGVFIAASFKKIRLGVCLCVLATLTFALNTQFALHGRGATQVLPPFALGLKTLLTNPVYFVLDLARATKLAAMLHVLAPLSLVPLFPASALSLVMPGILFTSATTQFWPVTAAAAQYSMVWIPGCILSVAFALRRLRHNPSRRGAFLGTIVALSIALASHSYDFGLLLRRDALSDSAKASVFQATPEGDKRYADLQGLVRRIPATASVAATTYLVSHVSNRVDVFDASRPYGEPDYILFSTRELVNSARNSLSDTFAKHRYALVAQAGEFYLFRRAAETPATHDALRSLGLRHATGGEPR